MKNKEELNALKEEVETIDKKLRELTDEELQQVSGGTIIAEHITDSLNEQNDELNLFELSDKLTESNPAENIYDSVNFN